MSSLGNEKRPKKFSEFQGCQDGPSRYLQSVIKNNRHPNCLLITGDSGSGKTTLAHLYARATLCLNRKKGESEPCGECAICKAHEPENIFEYTVKEASDFKANIANIIALAQSQPVIPTMKQELRADQFRRIIILDEIQNASRQSISALLDPLETTVASTTIILISMDIQKLDTTVREAIESRAVEIKLPSHSNGAVADNLIRGMDNKLDEGAAAMIAFLAKGNMRRAWSIMQFFSDLYSVEEITEDAVARDKLSGASPRERMGFWNALGNGQKVVVKSYLNEWKRMIGEDLICELLIKDLCDNEITDQGLEMLSKLSVWYHAHHRVPLLAVCTVMSGAKVFKDVKQPGDLKARKEKTLRPVNATIEKVVVTEELPLSILDEQQPINPSFPTEDTDVMTKPEMDSIIANNISDLAQIAGRKLHTKVIPKDTPEFKEPIPLFFSFTKWSEFINYYCHDLSK